MVVHTIEFKNVSGKMRLTDPCYDLSVKYAATVEVLPGDWFAVVSKNEEGDVWRVKVLSRSYPIGSQDLSKVVVPVDSDLDCFMVDSGQFGFFDFQYFPKDGKDEEFYDRVCWANRCGGCCVAEDGAAFGVVVCSGWGDGGYDVKGWKVDGKYVGFEVEFLGEDEDGWDEDDCYGEEE